MMEWFEDWWWVVMAAILVPGFGFGIVRDIRRSAACEKVTVTILDVGGCRRGGTCGVRLSDGTFAARQLPVVGQSFVTCKDEAHR